MQAQNKQLEVALLSQDKLNEFLSSDAANVTQICSVKFESSLRRIAFQAISKKDIQTVGHILRVIKLLAIQNYEKGIHVVIRAGLSAVLDKILYFISNLPVEEQCESREIVLKLFLENTMLIAPMLHDHCKWLKGCIAALLKILRRSFLQLQVTNMVLDHLNQVVMSLPRQDVYALRSVVSGSSSTMSLCKSMMCDLGLLGDYQAQTGLIELLVRITSSNTRHKFSVDWNCNDAVLGQLFSDITYEAFDQTVRRYLTTVNRKRPNSVMSFPLRSVTLGDDVFDKQCWADLCFPSRRLTLSFTLSADSEDAQMCESLDAASVKKFRFEDSGKTLTVTVTSRIPLQQVFDDDVVHSDSCVMILLLDKSETPKHQFEESLSSLLGDITQEGSDSPADMKQSLPLEGILPCNRATRTTEKSAMPSQLDRSFSQDVVLTSQPKESKSINFLPLQVSDRKSSSHHDKLKRRLELQEVKVMDRAKLVNESLQDSQSVMSQSSFTKTSRPADSFATGILKEIIPETQTADVSRDLDTSCHLHLSQLHAIHQEEVAEGGNPVIHMVDPRNGEASIDQKSHPQNPDSANASMKQSFHEESHIPALLSHNPCTSNDASKISAPGKRLSSASKEGALVYSVCHDLCDETLIKALPKSFSERESSDNSTTIPPYGGQLEQGLDKSTVKIQTVLRDDASKPVPRDLVPATRTRSVSSKKPPESGRSDSCQISKSYRCDNVCDHDAGEEQGRCSWGTISGTGTSTVGRPKTGKQSISGSYQNEAKKKMANKVNAQFKHLEETLGGGDNKKERSGELKTIGPQGDSDEQQSRTTIKRRSRNSGREYLQNTFKGSRSTRFSKIKSNEGSPETKINCDVDKRKVGKLRRRLTAHEVAQYIVGDDADNDRESVVSNRRKRRSGKSVVMTKKPAKLAQEYKNRIDVDETVTMPKNEARTLRSRKKDANCNIVPEAESCHSGGVEQASSKVMSEKKLRFEFDPYSFVPVSETRASTKKKRRDKKDKIFDCSGVSSTSTCSDLSWIRTHKANATSSNLFGERPLKTFSSKRKCPLGGVLSYAEAISEPIDDKELDINEVSGSSSSPETARDASPRPVIEPLNVSDYLSRPPSETATQNCEGSPKLSVTKDPTTRHVPSEANGWKTPTRLSSADTIAPSQCSHISLVKTPFAKRPQEMANGGFEPVTSVTASAAQSKILIDPNHQLSEEKNPNRETTDQSDQKLKCATKRINNTTPHDGHNRVYDVTQKRKRSTTKRQKRPVGLDFSRNVGKSSKPTSGFLNSAAGSDRRRDGRAEGKSGTDVSGQMKRVCCLIMHNMEEVQEVWEDFTAKRNLKFEAQMSRVVALSEQHDELMRKVERLEEDSLSKLKEHQKRFDDVIDDVNRSATCMEETNKKFYHEQCGDDVGFCDVMQALNDDVTRHLNDLMKTSHV